jgi:predicted metal-dependent enzyme (double-stranded beta helix superfamily)
METKPYLIEQLVADLRDVCADATGERDILSRGRPLARRAALSKAAWLTGHMYDTDSSQGFGVHLLHEDSDHALAIFAVSWLPDRGTPPHDHGTWAIVVGVDGPEKNEFYERVDDRSRSGYAELRKIGAKVFEPGEVVAMPTGTIHSVWNESSRVTLSLHIYGRHINYTGRSQFDPDKRTETPFILRVDEP